MKFLFFILILLSSNLFSQTINGKLNGNSNKDINYVRINVLKDSSILKTVFSDSLGNFTINNLVKGSYILALHKFPYNDKIIYIKFYNDTLINISFPEKIAQLNEVIVKSERPVFQKKGEKFIFDVENPLVQKGNSLWDVLKETPLVTVDEQGSISISGAEGVTIFINGKKSFLSGLALVNYLKNISSDKVSKIELLTIPSSKFDAEGGGGIINIVQKKSETEGIKGTLSLRNSQATYNAQALNMDVSLVTKRLTIYTSQSLSNQSLYFKGNNIIEQLGSNIIKSINNNDIYRHVKNKLDFNSSFGLDYNFSSKRSGGLLLEFNNNSLRRENKTLTKFFNSNLYNSDSLNKTQSTDSEKTNELNANFYYSILTDTLGSKLNLSLDLLSYDERRRTFQSTYLTDSYWNNIDFRNSFESILPQRINNTSFSCDFEKKISSKLLYECGIKYSTSFTDNNVYFGNGNPANDEYEKDTSRSNYFKYNENIIGIYADYKKEINQKWDYQVGLRIEHTETKGILVNDNEVTNKAYTNLFPTGFLNYTLNNNNQFSIAITSRIQRPSFWDINPFRYYVSDQIYTTGNPFLTPARIYKQEVSYNYKSNLILQLSNTLVDNAFSLLRYSDAASSYQKTTNYGKSSTSSLNIVYSNRIYPYWFFRINGSLSLTKFQGEYSIYLINVSALNSNISTINGFTLSKKNKIYLTLNLSNSFTHKSENVKVGNQFLANITATKISNKFTFNAGISDLLRSSIDKYETIIRDQIIFENYYYDARNIYVSVLYRLGKDKVRDKSDRQTSNQEERERIK